MLITCLFGLRKLTFNFIFQNHSNLFDLIYLTSGYAKFTCPYFLPFCLNPPLPPLLQTLFYDVAKLLINKKIEHTQIT